MKMNRLRLTNVIENHFYLDFNWKDRCANSYVSRRGFRTENAVFVPRHRQDRQMVGVVAARPSSVAFRGDAFRQSVLAGPAIDNVGYAFAARARL